jgi:hypothetical protein
LNACEEVEADFGGGVAADAPLEDRYDLVGELLACAGTMEDRRGLEAVEFVELVIYRCIAIIILAWVGANVICSALRNEVVDIVILGRCPLCLVYERR